MVACKHKAPDRAQGIERIWTSMRVMRAFTLTEIVATAEVPINYVKAVVLAYRCAGVIRQTGEPVPYGKPGVRTYLLVRNTGPHAPRIRKNRTVIFDPNRNEFLEIRRGS